MKKLNVGADASVRPLTQKGITLIALIITIIVMLILVGVTINVALNGGLFDKAKTASEQTQIEVDKEILLSAVVASIGRDGRVNAEELETNAKNEGFTVTGEDFPYTCTSKNKNVFTVDENGTIEENTGEETVEWAYVESEDIYGKYLYYIGNKKEFKLKSTTLKAEIYSGNSEDYIAFGDGAGLKALDGTGEYINIDLNQENEDDFYIYIDSESNPQTEIIDINGGNINLNNLILNMVYFKLGENTSIKTIKGLDGLTELSEMTVDIYNCTSLTSITLPETLETIGTSALDGCSGLSSLVIPSRVTSISSGSALRNCTSLTDITIKKEEGSLDLSQSGLTAEQIASIKWEPEE